jgi:hypothetical protein
LTTHSSAKAGAGRYGGSGAGLPLKTRRWWSIDSPFQHFRATEIFDDHFYAELESSASKLIDRGLTKEFDPSRLSASLPNSPAYTWRLPRDVRHPMAIFYSQHWHDLLANLTGIQASGDVLAAVHHHLPGHPDGHVHRDVAEHWFVDPARPGQVNPVNPEYCDHKTGQAPAGTVVHPARRAATMIFYLSNERWTIGDGGETGLYLSGRDQVNRPAVQIPPTNNSMVVFANGPHAFHAQLATRRIARTSVVLWLYCLSQ